MTASQTCACITRDRPSFTTPTRDGRVVNKSLRISRLFLTSKAVRNEKTISRFHSLLGSKGKHSDLKREIPKNKVKEEEKPRVEDTPIAVDESLWKPIVISEAKGVAEAVVKEDKSGVFCKKCRKSDVTEECVYHSGQVM